MEIAAKPYGLHVRVCSQGDRPVTGRFDFASAAAVADLLAAKGHPVTFDGGRYSVGCDQASVETPIGATVENRNLHSGSASLPLGSPLDPNLGEAMRRNGVGFGGAGPAYVEPPTYERLTSRYRDPSKLLATLSKLPGLSVVADPDIPGPLLLAGPASIVKQAAAFMRDLDRCPDQVELQAVVVSSGDSSDRSRRFGIQLREPGTLSVGGFDPIAAATITIPGLRAYLDALRETATVRQNSTFSARVLLGEAVRLVDGQEVAIRAATSVTDRETRADVAYRSIGHKLAVTLDALDREAVVTIEHELSSIVGQTALGPTFATRSTVSAMRVALDRPTVVSLAGTDLATKTRSKGLLSRADATAVAKSGVYLVFALRRLPCVVDAPGGELLQPPGASAPGRSGPKNMHKQ